MISFHLSSFFLENIMSNNDQEFNDEFLAKLADPSTNETTSSDKKEEKLVEEPKTFENTMENLQSKPEETPIVEIEKVEAKPVKKETTSKTNKKKKTIEVVGSKEIKEREDPKLKIDNKIDIEDSNLDKRVDTDGEFEDDEKLYEEQEAILNESVDSFIHKNYEDVDEDATDVSKKVEIVSGKEETKSEKIVENIEKKVSREDRLKENNVYGGDGIISAFKLRQSRVSKILSKVNIKDTSTIDPIDINERKGIEKSKVYVSSILPTLKPCYSVVPLIISGTVITMSAFSWPDIRDICLIEEKNDDLDPSDEDYVYKKNQLFIEKRKKQLDLFYSHIFSVSGYPTKPSQDEFYGKIMKWPDFSQLFFAAYSATFKKAYDFQVMCPKCNLEQTRSILPKNLCFMLNKNINIDRLNYFLKKGSSVATNDESIEVYKEFQAEKLVEKSNTVYRTVKPLSDSAIVCSLKVPTVNEAIESMEAMVEVFRDKPLEYIAEDGTTISIDSSFGVNSIKELKNLKKYLYINSILVAEPAEYEDKIEVGYVEFKDKDQIFNTITNLSVVDYKELVNDPNLTSMINIAGIKHQFDAKLCDNENCKKDMGLMAVEPETLFFTIAERESQD